MLFWAVTVVNAPREMTGVRLAIGSNAASVWWVNGQEVIGIYNDRQTVIDDGVSKRLTLKKGPNVIRAAIVNAGGATDFCARFLDAEGNPIKGLTVNFEARRRRRLANRFKLLSIVILFARQPCGRFASRDSQGQQTHPSFDGGRVVQARHRRC